jgi:outer membrane protein
MKPERMAGWSQLAAALLIAGAAGTRGQADEARATLDASLASDGMIASDAALLTRAEAVAEALDHAPALAAAAQQEQAARSRATAVRRRRWGEIDAVASYSRYQDSQIVRPISRELLDGGFAGLPFDRDQWRYGATFQVPLYLGGRLSASIALASLQAEEAAALVQGSRWQLRFNVTSLYASAQTLDSLTESIDASLGALGETRRRLDLAVRIGKRPELDLLKLDDEIALTRARRASVVADRSRVQALLLALLGRDPAGELRFEPLPDWPGTLAASRDELRSLALAASPVQRASLAAQQSQQAERIARSALLPSVAAHGSFLRNDAPSIPGPLDTWELSVAASVPLFTGGAHKAELASARHAASAAETALTRARLDQEAQLVEALARWDAAGAADEAARAGVAAAREAARIEQIRYDTGAGAMDDLLRARARELGAEGTLAQARGDRVSAAARLNALCEKEVLP